MDAVLDTLIYYDRKGYNYFNFISLFFLFYLIFLIFSLLTDEQKAIGNKLRSAVYEVQSHAFDAKNKKSIKAANGMLLNEVLFYSLLFLFLFTCFIVCIIFKCNISYLSLSITLFFRKYLHSFLYSPPLFSSLLIISFYFFFPFFFFSFLSSSFSHSALQKQC